MTVSATSITKKLFLLCLIVFVLYVAKDFLMPLSIGAVIATLFFPFCKWLEKKGLARGFASIICMLVLVAFILGIVLLITKQIALLTTDIDLLRNSITNSAIHIQEYIFTQYGLSIAKQTQLVNTQVSSISSIIPFMANTLSSSISHFMLTLVYVFCFLYYRRHLKQFLLQLTSEPNQSSAEILLYKVANISQQYLFGLSKMIMCLWIMYGIGFSIIGIKNAWFFAILCGLLEIVPYIGNITGTTITTLVVAVQGGSPIMIISIISTYLLIQFIQGWVLEPLIVGAQVKINPLFTIIALILGQLVWGIPGMFLAIPFIAMFKIICDNVEQLKPYGFLISEIETKEIKISFLSKLKKWIHHEHN